jgi:ankyrin repeat protein
MFVGSFMLQAQNSNQRLNYALIDMAASGNLDSLIQILKHDPNIDFRDANSGTALYYAAQNNHLDIVKVLVYNGADVDYGLDNGFSPLMVACYNGFFDVAEYLARNGANTNDRDEYWATPLHYAVALGDYYMVDMLLFYGARADLLTYEKSSPLLVACMIGDTAIAQLLINKKVNIDQINKHSDSPLSVAVQQNDTVLFDFLISNGASPSSIRKGKYQPYAWALLNENNYAFEKLKPKELVLNSKNNRYNPLNIAYAQNDYSLVGKLKKQGYSSGWLPYFNTVNIELATSFNMDDAFYSFGLGLLDAKYNTGIMLSYGTRFKRKAVLFQEVDDTYMQLWERRRFFDFAFTKYFPIKMELMQMKLFAGLGAQFMFGHYDGIHKTISPSFLLVPQIGFQIDLKPLYFKLSYEYTAYNLQDISNHKLKIGLAYNINFINKPTQHILPWLE